MTMTTIKKSLRQTLLIIMVLPLSGCDQFMSNYHGLTEFLTRLQQQYASILSLMIAIAYISGALFFMKAFFELKRYGEQRTMMSSQMSLGVPVTYMIVGILFLFLPTVISMLTNAVFMTPNVILSYPGDSVDVFSSVSSAIYGMVQLVGLVAVMRAFYIIANSHHGGQQGGIPKALVHLAGGIIALNVEQFLHMLNNEL